MIVAMNTPPVSNSVMSAEFPCDSMGAADVSFIPSIVLASGVVPKPAIEVMVGTQPPP